MFEFTIREKDFLNGFLKLMSDYVNKSYKFTMTYLSNPTLADYRENERLILIVINKSVYQNLYSFLRLNDGNMQFSAFSCLAEAIYSMRLYSVLYSTPEYMHRFITSADFSLDECEYEILENKSSVNSNNEEFSLREFYNGVRGINHFKLKNSSISAQVHENNIYLGLSNGKAISDALQNEVRKNLIGAYLSLSKHTRQFFNGGLDRELEELEDSLYSMFLDYVKKFSV